MTEPTTAETPDLDLARWETDGGACPPDRDDASAEGRPDACASG